MSLPEVRGATPSLTRTLNLTLNRFPPWLLRAANLSEVRVADNEHVANQLAIYNHGTRHLDVWAKIPPNVIHKAIAHELWHGADDVFGHPHYFTSSPEWQEIHRNQPHFDIQKYETEALEYFADIGAKILMLGAAKLRLTNPDEVRFFTSWVIPTLTESFS